MPNWIVSLKDHLVGRFWIQHCLPRDKWHTMGGPLPEGSQGQVSMAFQVLALLVGRISLRGHKALVLALVLILVSQLYYPDHRKYLLAVESSKIHYSYKHLRSQKHIERLLLLNLFNLFSIVKAAEITIPFVPSTRDSNILNFRVKQDLFILSIWNSQKILIISHCISIGLFTHIRVVKIVKDEHFSKTFVTLCILFSSVILVLSFCRNMVNETCWSWRDDDVSTWAREPNEPIKTILNYCFWASSSTNWVVEQNKFQELEGHFKCHFWWKRETQRYAVSFYTEIAQMTGLTVK